MSYINNVNGDINATNTIGNVEIVTVDGYTSIVTATAQIQHSNVTGKLGIALITENDHNKLKNRDLPDQHSIDSITGLRKELDNAGKVKDVLVDGKSVVDENGNANIEIPNISEEKDPTVPQHVKGITEEDISNWNNKSEFSGDYNDLDNKPEIPEMPAPVEYNKDFNIFKENEQAKAFTDTGYIVDDNYIELQKLPDTKTTGTNKSVYTDDEINVIYDGSNKIRRAENGIDFDIIPLPYACKSMFYNPNNKRIFGLANGYFLYSDDNGKTWNASQSTYANNVDYISRAQPHTTGFVVVNKSAKTLNSLDENFRSNSSIKSSIVPDFVTQFSQYQFIWCNSAGTFKYGAGSQEGAFASLSNVTVNMLKTVNSRQIVGLKNSNKLYIIKNLSGVSENGWTEYILPDVCTVNDIIFNSYDKTYYIFTDINTYYKTKDFIAFDSIDKYGLRGIQGHFTLKGIQMITTEHDLLLLAPTRTKIENKLQEYRRDLDKTRWIGMGLELTEDGKVKVKIGSDNLGVSSGGIFLMKVDENVLSNDIVESLYVSKAEFKDDFDPYEFESWFWEFGYPVDRCSAFKIVFNQAGSFYDQVNWETEYMVEQNEYGYIFVDTFNNIFKYVKLGNLSRFLQ